VDHVAEHDVTDVVRAHARPADRLADHLGGQVTGLDGGETATVPANQGPYRGQDEHLFHSFLISHAKAAIDGPVRCRRPTSRESLLGRREV
jgi:hypothetical protein